MNEDYAYSLLSWRSGKGERKGEEEEEEEQEKEKKNKLRLMELAVVNDSERERERGYLSCLCGLKLTSKRDMHKNNK